MKAVILAAGLSTRVRALTNSGPKPMLPLAGVPTIEYGLRQLGHFGIRDVLVTTHYAPEEYQRAFGDGSKYGLRIKYPYSPVRLDTAGFLKFLAPELDEEFLVLGGAFLLPTLNFEELLAFHRESPRLGTVVLNYVHRPAVAALYGQAKLDSEQRIVEFFERRNPVHARAGVPEKLDQEIDQLHHFIHTTYQILSPRVLDYVPAGTPVSVPHLIGELLMRDQRLYGYVSASDRICVSDVDRYYESDAKMRQLAALISPPIERT